MCKVIITSVFTMNISIIVYIYIIIIIIFTVYDENNIIMFTMKISLKTSVVRLYLRPNYHPTTKE